LAIVSLCSVSASGVQAGPLYSNINNTSGGSDDVFNSPGPPTFANGPLADSFSTGSSPFTLADVILALSLDPTVVTTPGASISIDLFNDSSTSPGTQIAHIATLSDTDPRLSTSLADLSFPTSIALNPLTRYWIELSAIGNNSAIQWSFSNTISGPGVPGEFWWDSVNGTHTNDPSAGPFQMELAPPVGVPEPSSVVILVFGLLCTIAYARWRSSKQMVGLAAADA
jgi:hypothetical protein